VNKVTLEDVYFNYDLRLRSDYYCDFFYCLLFSFNNVVFILIANKPAMTCSRKNIRAIFVIFVNALPVFSYLVSILISYVCSRNNFGKQSEKIKRAVVKCEE